MKPLFILLFFCLGTGIFAQDGASPFASTRLIHSNQASAPAADSSVQSQPSTQESFFSTLVIWQHDFQSALSHALRNAKSSPWSPALWSLILFSFLYGVFHTLLPGHQKSVIGAYFLSEDARYVQGLLVGFSVAVFHALSTISIMLILRLGLQLAAGKSLNQASDLLQAVSIIGMLVISVFLLIKRLFKSGEVKRLADLDKIRKKLGFDWHERLETSWEPLPLRRLLPFLFFAGILPCPGSLMILLFALGVGSLGLGILSVCIISLGMAVTLTIIALAIIGLKRSGRHLVHSAVGRIGMGLLEMAGILALILFSILLWPTGRV